MKKIYIVDIDKTIFDTQDGNFYGAKPIPERIAKINRLYREGNVVIYWTARDAFSGHSYHEFTKKQLRHHGCEFTDLWSDKPNYDVWIDDKAINSEDYFK